MIQYTLKCKDGHVFDSWFQSADAFDMLLSKGMVSCAVCGICDVDKSVMAPRVQASSSRRDIAKDAPGSAPIDLAPTQAEQALAKLRRQIEENSDYVGKNFASEARAMYVGDAPERPIYGEARPDDARKLIEDGVPVAPLPFPPGRKTN